MSKFTIPIRHREWLPHCNIVKVFSMARDDKLPLAIEGWMLVTALKHPLRCVYGSDLKAALALLRQALWTKIKYPYDLAYYLWHRKEYEQEELRDLVEDVKAEMEERR
jgi:hypothetical protein